MTLGAWLHDLDPFLWQIGPGVGLRWYGLSYAAGFVIAWAVLRWLAGRGAVLIPKERAVDAILLSAILMVVGGRLGYILFYSPSLLWEVSSSPPWWGALAIHHGGMASHGGMIGLLVAALLIARGFRDENGRRVGRCPALHVLDAYALIGPFGIFLGRIANFINGELLGRIVARAGEPAPLWSVRYPQEVRERPFELSSEQVRGLHETLRLPVPPPTAEPGLTPEPATWHPEFSAKYDALVAQVQAGSQQAAEMIEPWLSARHPSQIYQAVAEGLITGLVVWLIARRPRMPGVLAAAFLMTYGLLRIVTEYWRLPDAHLEMPRLAGLSRGQWLSLGMMLIGLALLIWRRLNQSERVGGWLRPVQSDASARPR